MTKNKVTTYVHRAKAPLVTCPFCKTKKAPVVAAMPAFLCCGIYDLEKKPHYTVACQNKRCNARGPLRKTIRGAANAWMKYAGVSWRRIQSSFSLAE